MAKQTPTPIEELKALLPFLKGQLASADEDHINCVYRIAAGEKDLDSTFGSLKERMKLATDYLEPIAEHTSYYKNRPEAQELLKQAIGLMKKIE